jgi:hypothetical protein
MLSRNKIILCYKTPVHTPDICISLTQMFIQVAAVRTQSLVAAWMTGPLPKAPIRMDVDVRHLNMAAVQMGKQKLMERNLKDVRKCQSCLEVSLWHILCWCVGNSMEGT